jgi:5-methylcytosine-specific restriction endonuclease McrA
MTQWKNNLELPGDEWWTPEQLWELVHSQVEQRVLYRHLKRARNLKLPATLTMNQWYETLLYFHGFCAYCLRNAYGVLEHFIPLSSGGGTTWNNCIPACQSCNVRKTQYTLETSSLERVQRYLQSCREEVMS